MSAVSDIAAKKGGTGRDHPLRVVHALATFLEITENWIYPQIVRTPRAQSRVYCHRLANLPSFPLRDGELCKDPPDRSLSCGIPRALDSLAFRLGQKHLYSRLRLKHWRPQILHAHFGMFGWEVLFMKRALRVPMITSFYGMDAWLLPILDPVWQTRYAELFERGDLFLVEGPAMRQRLSTLGCPLSKIQIHRLGVDVNFLPFRERDFSAKLRVIMVGRFVEKKGLPDGLAACALAAEQGVDLTVTIVGDASPDDPAGQEIKRALHEIAARPPLDGRVVFAGFLGLNETRALMQKHDVFLCPSRHSSLGDGEGGSPLALTEAMAMGLLCIGTRHCDIPEVILPGETGILCESGDVQALGNALREVAENREMIRTLCQKGRRHIEEKFSVATQADERADIYRSVVAAHSR